MMNFRKMGIGILLVVMPFVTSATSIITRFSAVIFDCDGVLVDTEYLKFISWKKALEPYHIVFTLEEYMPLIGNSTEFILEKILTNKKVSLPKAIILDQKKEIYKKLQNEHIPVIEPAVLFAKKTIFGEISS